MKNITTFARVTDTNNRDAGTQPITLELFDDGDVFALAIGGQVFYRTCKKGESRGIVPSAAPVGTPMFELESESFERAWVDAAGLFVHLD